MEKCCSTGQATDDNIIRRIGIAYWITKATDTESEYGILIDFPLQQRLLNARVLRYTYIVCLVLLIPFSV